MTPRHAAIIGAGACGLAIGWLLAKAGWWVSVFDRGEAGYGATYAAAGMLAACLEFEPGEEKLLVLGQESQARWSDFAAILSDEADLCIGYRGDGSLSVAFSSDDRRRLSHQYESQRRAGLGTVWLDGDELRRREPMLRPGAVAALFCADDHLVDSRRLTDALIVALRRAGGELFPNHAVTEIDRHGETACGVVLHDGTVVAADAVILAAGAWSGHIAGAPTLPIRPVKGQSLAVRMDAAQPILHHVSWVPGGYLVPHRDGRLIIGATVEECGFNSDLTAGGMLALLHMAWTAIPGIQDLPIIESWVGFRPGSPDDAPIIGRCAVENLWLATGHHRNGILLLPITAQEIVAEICGCTVSAWLAPFANRFGG